MIQDTKKAVSDVFKECLLRKIQECIYIFRDKNTAPYISADCIQNFLMEHVKETNDNGVYITPIEIYNKYRKILIALLQPEFLGLYYSDIYKHFKRDYCECIIIKYILRIYFTSHFNRKKTLTKIINLGNSYLYKNHRIPSYIYSQFPQMRAKTLFIYVHYCETYIPEQLRLPIIETPIIPTIF